MWYTNINNWRIIPRSAARHCLLTVKFCWLLTQFSGFLASLDSGGTRNYFFLRSETTPRLGNKFRLSNRRVTSKKSFIFCSLKSTVCAKTNKIRFHTLRHFHFVSAVFLFLCHAPRFILRSFACDVYISNFKSNK